MADQQPEESKEMDAFEMYVAYRKMMTFTPWQAWSLIAVFILCGVVIVCCCILMAVQR